MEKLNSVLRQRSNFEGRQWVWVYDDKCTISGAGKHVLKAPGDGTTRKSFPLVSKLARCWTDPYYVLIVGPGEAPDGDLVGRNLLLLDMRHEDSRHINARVLVHIYMQNMLQPARGRAKIKLSALGDESLRPE